MVMKYNNICTTVSGSMLQLVSYHKVAGVPSIFTGNYTNISTLTFKRLKFNS
jgi:hypothetical protein